MQNILNIPSVIHRIASIKLFQLFLSSIVKYHNMKAEIGAHSEKTAIERVHETLSDIA